MDSDTTTNTASEQSIEPECDEEAKLGSVALAQLLKEVRNDEPSQPHAYNRMHNRHNR